MIPEWEAAFRELTEQDCIDYIYNLTINRTYWHGHQGCKYAHLPSTNLEYWEKKIADNLERDKRKTQELERLGYQVSVVWQCQLKPKVREQNLRNLYNNIVEHT